VAIKSYCHYARADHYHDLDEEIDMPWDKVMDFVKTVGAPAVVTLILAALIYQMQKDAAAERVAHTALLIDQLSDLRDCTCKR
jgi:hypothetical protein